MATTYRLSAAERAFLTLAARAAFSNPFSDEFDALQLEIAGCDALVPAAERLPRTIARWNELLHRLHAAGVTRFQQATGDDRELLRLTCLYEIYHRYFTAFDQLIADQLAAGDRSVRVPFAGKALTLFARRGFAAEEARRYFAIMYQIRRAYQFIDHGLVGQSPCMKELRRHL